MIDKSVNNHPTQIVNHHCLSPFPTKTIKPKWISSRRSVCLWRMIVVGNGLAPFRLAMLRTGSSPFPTKTIKPRWISSRRSVCLWRMIVVGNGLAPFRLAMLRKGSSPFPTKTIKPRWISSRRSVCLWRMIVVGNGPTLRSNPTGFTCFVCSIVSLPEGFCLPRSSHELLSVLILSTFGPSQKTLGTMASADFCHLSLSSQTGLLSKTMADLPR